MKTEQGVRREYNKVLREIKKTWEGGPMDMGAEGDPFWQDVGGFFDTTEEAAEFVNLLGWGRSLGWVLGIRTVELYPD